MSDAAFVAGKRSPKPGAGIRRLTWIPSAVMTRRQLRHRLFSAIAVLAVVLAAAVSLKLDDVPLINAHDQQMDYELVKDVSPLLLGILAVFLTSWYQQRMAFLAAMRALWSHMINAKTAMLAYTDMPTRPDDAYRDAYREISRAIDEMRTVYRNVGEDANHRGWFPYEPLHDMRKIFEALRGDPNDDAVQQAKREIDVAWEALRWPFLSELGMPEPSEPIVQRNVQSQRIRGPRPER
jgi:hypothetical protein